MTPRWRRWTPGSLGPLFKTLDIGGSIPAHAGEPVAYPGGTPCHWVYPRPRGGARWAARDSKVICGLSPPTRGSPARYAGVRSPRGSIPAHAGEPVIFIFHPSFSGVYPRPRGGAISASPERFYPPGLSPPTRGSHVAEDEPGSHAGSIPAHAGEPAHRCLARRPAMVYPRPRGGASLDVWINNPPEGLSPPTRGSQAALVLLIHARGSIPAHAGEPPPP